MGANNGINYATFTPIKYTSKLADTSLAAGTLNNMTEKHLKAKQGQAEIAKQLREIGLNPAEDQYINDLSEQYNKRIEDSISDDTGYAGNALSTIFEVGKDIQSNKVLWDKVRDNKLYSDAKAKVEKMHDAGLISDKTLNRWNVENPYTSTIKYSGESDESAKLNRALGITPETKAIGTVAWSPNFSPVKAFNMAEFFTDAMKYVSDQKGGYEKVTFLDKDGNPTTDINQSVDKRWYSKTGNTYSKLSEDKIYKACEEAFKGNALYRESLLQEYQDERFDYDKNKGNYVDNAGLLNKGLPKSIDHYIDDKFRKVAGLKAYDNVTSSIDYNDTYLKEYALRGGSGTYDAATPNDFITGSGVSILHDTNETFNIITTKTSILKQNLTDALKNPKLNLTDSEINTLLTKGVYNQLDATGKVSGTMSFKDFIDNEVKLGVLSRNEAFLLKEQKEKMDSYNKIYDKAVDICRKKDKDFDKYNNFINDVATGNIFDSDNEISKSFKDRLFKAYDVNDATTITIDLKPEEKSRYERVLGVKIKNSYNIKNDLGELIQLISKSNPGAVFNSELANRLTINSDSKNVSDILPDNPAAPQRQYMETSSDISDLINGIAYRYKYALKEKEKVVLDCFSKKAIDTPQFGVGSFAETKAYKNYIDGKIEDNPKYKAEKEAFRQNIKDQLMASGFANYTVYGYNSADANKEGAYLRKYVDSSERVSLNELVKDALAKDEKSVTIRPTINFATGRPAIYVSIPGNVIPKGPSNNDREYIPGITLLIDDLEKSQAVEEYMDDDDTEAMIEYRQLGFVDGNYDVYETGIKEMDGTALDCSDPSDIKTVNCISSIIGLKELYNYVSLGIPNDKNVISRMNSKITEISNNLASYYGERPEVFKLQILNKINELSQ